MNSSLSQQAQAIIQKILYITIASVSKNGQPWNSPVYSAFDEKYNFYWTSWKETQHSRNIQENPHIFLVIYDSTAPEGTGRGVYIQATAQMVTDEQEISLALALLYTRKNQSPDARSPHEFLDKYPRRIYQATPQKTWMNSGALVNGNFVDKRVVVYLNQTT